MVENGRGAIRAGIEDRDLHGFPAQSETIRSGAGLEPLEHRREAAEANVTAPTVDTTEQEPCQNLCDDVEAERDVAISAQVLFRFEQLLGSYDLAIGFTTEHFASLRRRQLSRRVPELCNR